MFLKDFQDTSWGGGGPSDRAGRRWDWIRRHIDPSTINHEHEEDVDPSQRAASIVETSFSHCCGNFGSRKCQHLRPIGCEHRPATRPLLHARQIDLLRLWVY